MPQQICFTIEDDLLQQIDDLRQKTGQSRSSMIETLLKAAIETSAPKPLTKEYVGKIIKEEMDRLTPIIIAAMSAQKRIDINEIREAVRKFMEEQGQ